MHIARKIVVTIAALLLPAALGAFGFLLSFGQVMNTPDKLKEALTESRIYESAVASLVRQSGGEVNTGPQQAGVLSGQEEVQDAITQALPAETLENHTSQILDGVYAWLQGDASAPTFQVDLTGIRDTLAGSLSEQAKTRAAQLPPCEPGPDTTASVQDFNSFEADCLPAGISPDMVAQKTSDEVLASDLFKDPVLDANDIRTNDGTPLQEQLKPVSEVYKAVHDFTVASGITTALLAAIIVFLSSPLYAGLRRLGKILLGVGAASALLALLGGVLTNAAVNAVARSSGEASVQTAVAKAVQVLTNDIRTWWLAFGVVLIVLGVGALVGQSVLKKRERPGVSGASVPVKGSGRPIVKK